MEPYRPLKPSSPSRESFKGSFKGFLFRDPSRDPFRDSCKESFKEGICRVPFTGILSRSHDVL